jgi:hypothetical protein
VNPPGAGVGAPLEIGRRGIPAADAGWLGGRLVQPGHPVCSGAPAMAIPEGITATERRKATCPQGKGITAWVIFIGAGG